MLGACRSSFTAWDLGFVLELVWVSVLGCLQTSRPGTVAAAMLAGRTHVKNANLRNSDLPRPSTSTLGPKLSLLCKDPV